jgi:hypothetical protein
MKKCRFEAAWLDEAELVIAEERETAAEAEEMFVNDESRTNTVADETRWNALAEKSSDSMMQLRTVNEPARRETNEQLSTTGAAGLAGATEQFTSEKFPPVCSNKQVCVVTKDAAKRTSRCSRPLVSSHVISAEVVGLRVTASEKESKAFNDGRGLASCEKRVSSDVIVSGSARRTIDEKPFKRCSWPSCSVRHGETLDPHRGLSSPEAAAT